MVMKLVNLLCLVVLCNSIESPQYAVVHSESDFEVRLYGDSTWMSAPVRQLSFEKATLLGFHRYRFFTRQVLTSMKNQSLRKSFILLFDLLSFKFIVSLGKSVFSVRRLWMGNLTT